jgi:tRNA(fMet)-specific endonuclease VapC
MGEGIIDRAERRESEGGPSQQGPLEWIPFDDDDSRAAGEIRAELEAAGTPIGAYDVLLADQARRRGATLVTSKLSEFRRVASVKWEDWAVPRRR